MAAPAAADCGHDGALRASGNVGLKSGFQDASNDVLDLLFGRAVRHIHNHDDRLSVCLEQNKSRDTLAALVESLSCLYFPGEWLRFCTSAANGNPKRPNGRKLLNRVIENSYCNLRNSDA